MRNRLAKRLRRIIYGEHSHRHRKYIRDSKTGMIILVKEDPRRLYKILKRDKKQVPPDVLKKKY